MLTTLVNPMPFAAAGVPVMMPRALPIRLVVLTNFLPPVEVPFYEEVARRVGQLTILLSTPLEANRSWQPDWRGLDVRVQRTTTLKRIWRHEAGFADEVSMHFPWDTIGQLRRLQPDAIVSCELGARTLLSTLYARLFRRTPLVVWAALSEHTERGRSWFRRILRKRLLRRADAMAVNGPSGRRYLKLLGVDDDRIVRVPYTTMPGTFDTCPVTREDAAARRLLYYGQLVPRKGIVPFTKALIRWAANRPAERIEFTIVGNGPQREELISLAPPTNLQITFRPQANYEELREHCASAGILVYPTLCDEWGLGVNEGMAAGLPVLGSLYSQAVEELCVEGETGWVFRPDVPGEIESALDRAWLCSTDDLNAMRRAARERVAFITPDHAADCLLEAVERATQLRSGKEAGR